MAARMGSDSLVALPDGLYPYERRKREKLPEPDKSVRRMELGAIVILDALGFKGIWAREDATQS
jgi:hypothetical protein